VANGKNLQFFPEIHFKVSTVCYCFKFLPPVANLLTVSLIPDTGAGCDLTCEYLHEFSKKIEMTIRLFSGALGKMIHEKNQKQKSRNYVPLNGDVHFPI
jgi:hypothetical protein